MDTPWLLVALTLFYAFLFWRAWTTGEIGGKSVYRKITRTERPQIFYMLCFIYAVLGIACAVFATFAFREGSLQNVISNFA